ncbi:MAG: isoprenylcysteine carboxylmethyltransferase family protein [Patescibacteria group bacterium]
MKKIVSIPPNYFYLSLIISVLFFYFIPSANLINFPYNSIGLILVIVGFYLIIRSWLLFRKHQTPESFADSTRLVIENLYRFSRNPMYLGGVISLLGLAIFLGNLISLLTPVVFFLVTNFMFIPYEEEKMIKTFGQEYLNYKNKTRRWF